MTKSVYDLIKDERARQNTLWGGPKHDDEHDQEDWANMIRRQVDIAEFSMASGARDRFVKVAALAVAAIESLERKQVTRGVSPLVPTPVVPTQLPFGGMVWVRSAVMSFLEGLRTGKTFALGDEPITSAEIVEETADHITIEVASRTMTAQYWFELVTPAPGSAASEASVGGKNG